ncbi:hypothetical protein EV1_037734 [Malus domestica]
MVMRRRDLLDRRRMVQRHLVIFSSAWHNNILDHPLQHREADVQELLGQHHESLVSVATSSASSARATEAQTLSRRCPSGICCRQQTVFFLNSPSTPRSLGKAATPRFPRCLSRTHGCGKWQEHATSPLLTCCCIISTNSSMHSLDSLE